MSEQMNDLSIIASQVRKAMAGESAPTDAEAFEYMAAVRRLLGSAETPVKDAGLNVIALAALAGMNDRLRAAAICARSVASARLQ